MRQMSDIILNQHPLIMTASMSVRAACEKMRERRAGSVLVTAVDALRLMWDWGFRHLPVCDQGKILGVVSRGDFKGNEQDRLDEEVGLWQRLR